MARDITLHDAREVSGALHTHKWPSQTHGTEKRMYDGLATRPNPRVHMRESLHGGHGESRYRYSTVYMAPPYIFGGGEGGGGGVGLGTGPGSSFPDRLNACMLACLNIAYHRCTRGCGERFMVHYKQTLRSSWKPEGNERPGHTSEEAKAAEAEEEARVWPVRVVVMA